MHTLNEPWMHVTFHFTLIWGGDAFELKLIANITLEFRDHVDIMKLSIYDVENKNVYPFYFIDKHYIALTFTSMHISL